MGMFDYLRCDVPLPSGEAVEGPVWQTKSGPCEMQELRISKDGRLIFQKWHFETVPDEEARPGPLGSIRRVIDGTYDADYHGDIYFYRCDAGSDWEAYRARFTNGDLEWIRPASGEEN